MINLPELIEKLHAYRLDHGDNVKVGYRCVDKFGKEWIRYVDFVDVVQIPENEYKAPAHKAILLKGSTTNEL